VSGAAASIPPIETRLLDIAIDQDTGKYALTTTLRVADRFRLTLYDAAYLELAR
jgi:predicted nucleic acid-binding protein